MDRRHPMLTRALALATEGKTKEALDIIAHLASMGDAEALFTYADAIWRGFGIEQDLVRGRAMFEAAAEAGHPLATRAATNLLASGIAGPRDWPQALRRLEAEAMGDARRAHMLRLIREMDLTAEGEPARLPDGEELSDRPFVRLFRGAFTAAECDFLMVVAEPTYEPSLVIDEAGLVRDRIRTSDGSTIHWLIEDPATHAVNRRLAALTGTRPEQGEALQILRYRPGQEYRPHVDWLGEENPRILTALIYLNDGYEGGETAFVKTGLQVCGRRGDALVFKSQSADGGLDPLSEHAGLPVTRGTKYLASRWIRAGRHAP